MLVRVPLRQAILAELARVKKKSKTKWTSGLDLERLAEKLGFKPSSGGRRSRELAAKGHILRSETADGFVQYKAL